MARELLSLENATLLFKNFSGTESKFNHAGDRNFCVFIDNDLAMDLASDGWTVKKTNPRDPDEEPKYYIKVKVSYKIRAPKVYRISGRSKVALDEDTIGELDWANIVTADVDISPSHYEYAGKSGYAGYLESLYVVINKSRFEDKYNFEEETPFN